MLMDFGMAPDLRMAQGNEGTEKLYGKENIGYMCPEFVERGQYTEHSDVYAFAMLMLQVRKLLVVSTCLRLNVWRKTDLVWPFTLLQAVSPPGRD